MAEKFVVVVGLAAVAPGVNAANKKVDALVQTATGSPRDYTEDERAAAVADLAALGKAGDADAVAALIGLVGGAQHAAALSALSTVRGDAAGQAFVDVLARTDVGNEKNAAQATTLMKLAAGTRAPRVVPAIVRVVDDGATKELRVAGLRALGAMGGGPFDKQTDPGCDAATAALVRYVDHRVLAATARDVLLHMRASTGPLTPLLQHDDAEVRALATRLLGGSGAPDVSSAVKSALAQQLRDAPDDKTRARALRGLAAEFCGDAPHGAPDAPCPADAGRQLAALVVPHLRNVNVGDAAVDAVRRVRDASLVPPLIAALDHPSSSVREKSAELLGKIGDPRAKPALVRKLDTTKLEGNWSELDGYMRGLVGCGVDADDAAFFAGFLGRRDIASTSFSWNHPQMWQALSRLPPSSSKAFTPLLRNPSRDTKKSIAKLLGQLGDPGAAVALLDVIEENDDVKDEAAAALAACGDTSALPRMQKILEKKLAQEPWNGGGALALSYVRLDRTSGLERTLSHITRQTPLAVELLRALLKETHPSDAKAFATAFQQKSDDVSTTYTYQRLAILGWAQIDTPASLETLCAIATGHGDDGVRTRAAVALKRFPEPKAIGCMVTALSTSKDGRDEIVRALQDATGEELTSWKEWRVYVDGGFGVGGGEAALQQALTSTNPQARALAATQLGKQKKALPALEAALSTENAPEARLAILTAIAAHDQPTSKQALLAELEKQRSTWAERVVLARALERLGDGRGTLAILQKLDGEEAQQAMTALSETTGEPPTSSSSYWKSWWKQHAERYRMPDR